MTAAAILFAILAGGFAGVVVDRLRRPRLVPVRVKSERK